MSMLSNLCSLILFELLLLRYQSLSDLLSLNLDLIQLGTVRIRIFCRSLFLGHGTLSWILLSYILFLCFYLSTMCLLNSLFGSFRELNNLTILNFYSHSKSNLILQQWMLWWKVTPILIYEWQLKFRYLQYQIVLVQFIFLLHSFPHTHTRYHIPEYGLNIDHLFF